MKQIKFPACPVCRTRRVIVQMPDDWQTRVEAGAAIPIVGCGNPWHYRFPDEVRLDDCEPPAKAYREDTDA